MMPRFRQRGRLDSSASTMPGSYSESDSDDHSRELVHTPLGFERHYDEVSEVNSDSSSLFENTPPGFNKHYDEVPEANDQRFMRHFARTGSKNTPLVGVVSSLNNIRSPAKQPSQVAGDMFRRYSESHMPRECDTMTQSLSRADTSAPASVEDAITPYTDKDRNQDVEQFVRKKRSTLKAKTADKKSNIAHANLPDLQVENRNPTLHWLDDFALRQAKERVCPKLKSFDEVHRQLRDQDVLPPSRYSPQQQSHHRAKAHEIDPPLLKNIIDVLHTPHPSQAFTTLEKHVDTTLLMECLATANMPYCKQHESTKTVPEGKKQVAMKMHRIQERPRMVYDELNNSDSEIIPVISQSGHSTKASDVKTATGFASPHNPDVPVDSMIDKILEVADYKTTRDEAFKVLRMYGANLVAAVSVYRNAMGPEHLRQMLRAWLGPLEDAEFRTAAQFYTKNVDNQGIPWGVPFEKKVDVEEAECQPIPVVISVGDAFAKLGLQDYNSVDFATLQSRFQNELTWYEAFSQPQQQLQQAYDSIFQHQNDNDCWKLCPIPWTKEKDEKLIQWKNEDPQIRWAAIAAALSLKVQECKDRIEFLMPEDGKFNKIEERESKKQQQKDAVKVSSVRTATPELGGWGGSSVGDWGPRYHCKECDTGYYGILNHDCEAGRARFDENLPAYVPLPIWGSSTVSTSTLEPKAHFSSTYAVTYWATIESGDKTVHIPVDSSNVSGPEKAIIEGSASMKKVWKWVNEKCLGDKVTLQDAFDLAKDMHGKEADEGQVAEEPRRAQNISRASSHSSVGKCDMPVHTWCSHDCSNASSGSVHDIVW